MKISNRAVGKINNQKALKKRFFGFWEVLGPAKNTAYLRCRCRCGLERDVRRDGLLAGKTTSCGCRTRKPVKDYAPTFQILGQPMTVQEIEKVFRTTKDVFYARRQIGWDDERAAMAPKKPRNKNMSTDALNDVLNNRFSIQELIAKHGLTKATIYRVRSKQRNRHG